MPAGNSMSDTEIRLIGVGRRMTLAAYR